MSPRARSFARQWIRSIAAFVLIAAAAAFLMSLGPEMRSGGRLISEVGPVPFPLLACARIRRPSRAGALRDAGRAVPFYWGGARCRRARTAIPTRRRSRCTLAALAVVEAFAAPIAVNGTVAEGRYAMPPARVYTGEQVPGVYRFLKSLPAPGTVVVEFPLGEWAYEMRYVFYSTAHWHPLLNGYSGHFPLSYHMNATHLRHPLEYPDSSWETLMRSGATHAVVHLPYYRYDEGEHIGRWLAEKGARQVGEFDGDQRIRFAIMDVSQDFTRPRTASTPSYAQRSPFISL